MVNLLLQILANSDSTVNLADSAKIHLSAITSEITNNPHKFVQDFGQSAIDFGLKVLAAIAIYIVGAWLIKKVKLLLKKFFQKKGTEGAIASFVTSLTTITLTVLLLVITIGALGVNTTSLAALLAAGGMAIGMALSGTVQNFAGGIMILAFKPFKSGDYIEAQGYSGTVTEVNIVSTKLTTVDNRSIILPNGALSNGNINNYSQHKIRRVEWLVDVEYGSDSDNVKNELFSLLDKDKRILHASHKGAADPFIALSALKDSSIEFVVRAWVKAEDYWNVYFSYNETVYTELPKKGINFPFPQMDVHVSKLS
ncbi:MAG: mechanosensitive ion channel [Bacteroidales bacterium]|jgi:small conductance mechanosensitive channel|nr:mechanosensitive ion channel [Bacteroidales bacterium]